jgi:hypothetical protein
MNKSGREVNVPMAFIGCIAIILILAVLFGPALAAFCAAGAQDGFTLDAFDFGPSPWWSVGIVLFTLGAAGLVVGLWKILSIRIDQA